MKKLKKLHLSLACFALGAALTLVGTLAYLQDETDTAYNVMTSGNVKIEQLELERNADKLVNVTKGKPADPAVYNDGNVSKDVSINWASLGYNGTSELYADSIGNVVDNFVFIKNTGSNAAYVRTVIAIECPTGLDNDIHVNKNVNGISWSTFYTNIDGVRYMLLVATYVNALAGGATSAPSLLQLYLDPTVMNEDTALFGDTWDVLVISQAVQTTGFQASENAIADYALDKAFGDVNENNTPWTRENDPQKPEIPVAVDTAAEFKAALANGGSIVITKDIEVSEIAVIPEGVAVELDLNGKTISADVENTDNFHIIENNGTLVINDETGKGKIELVDAVPSATAGYATNVIRNNGKLVVNGGTLINNLNLASYAIDNAPGGVTVVNGGKIINTNAVGTAIRVYATNADKASELVVNGGEIVGGYGIRLQNLNTTVKSAAKVTVNGGEITGNDSEYHMALYSLCHDGTNFEINLLGGTFNGYVAFGGGNKVAYETVLVDLDCDFNGEVFSYNDNAKFGYVVYTAEDFRELLVADTTDTIVLGANISIDADDTITIANGTSKTIDLNGYTLGGVSDGTTNRIMFDVRGTLTVKNGNVVYQHVGADMGWGAMVEPFYVGFNGTLNVENATIENLGGSAMAYCIDLVNATNTTVNVNNSTLKSTYIPVRVFNNSTNGVNNVTIKNSTLSGKYAFWTQTYLNDGRTAEQLAVNLNYDIFDGTNAFISTAKPVTPVIAGFATTYYFLADGTPAMTAESLQAAIDNATDGAVIKLTNDVSGTVVITQPENADFNIVIDGQGFKFDGTIKIKGMSQFDGADNDSIVIKNINFTTSTKDTDFIWSSNTTNGTYWRYAHNVTVENCTFTATGDAKYSVVGVRFQQAYNIKVVNCVATGVHSLLQAESCETTVEVNGCKVVDGKSGVSLNNTMNAIVKNCEFESVVDGGYGIRHKGQVNGYALTVENCKINAFVPVLVRNMTASSYSATFSGNNKLTATNDFGYQVVFSGSDWDNDANAPAVPTGNYTVTGADSFTVFGK